MKKRIAIALMLVLVFASLSMAAPKYEWKISHIRPQDSPIDLDIKEFVKKVSERSEGRITINIFNSSGLGDYQVVHERVGLGSVDMAIQSMGTQSDQILQIVNLCYLITGWDEASKYMRISSPMMQWVAKRLEKQDIKLIGIWPVYFGGIALKKEPTEPFNPDVNKNVKVRVPGSKVWELLAESQGYQATPLAFSEVFTALQTGMVNGAIGAGAEGYYSNFRDVVTYYIPNNTHFELWFFIMNKELYDSLSPEDRKIVDEEALAMENRRFVEGPAQQAMFEKKLEEYGIKIIRPDDAAIKNFARVAREKVWPELRSLLGEKVFDEFVGFFK
ncbi:MAG: TRAP transporter substrate-binding protein DctP [Aminobacteriaceae bacterium]